MLPCDRLRPVETVLEYPLVGEVGVLSDGEVVQIVVAVGHVTGSERIGVENLGHSLVLGVGTPIVERGVVLYAERKLNIGKDSGVDVVRPVVAGHPVEEVKIVAAIVALLRIFHPAIFPIVVRVYSRNCSGHIGEIEVRQLAAALEAPDSGTDLQPLCHLTGNVGAELELLGSGVGDDSRIVDVGHRDEIFGPSVGAVGRKVVLLVYSFLIDRVHPVGVRIGDIVRVAGLGDSVRILGLLPPQVDHRLRERQDSVHILRRLVHKRHIIGIIGDHLELVGGLVDGHHSAVGDAYLTGGLASVLCGDEDDAVSSPVSVDGAGSRVLQHGHGLDVIRVHVGDRTLETIDYDKRIGGVQCPDTADPERKSFLARTAGSLAHSQTGVHSLKDLGGARHRTGFHLLGVIDSGDRSGDVHPFLRAVADDDKLVQFV